MNNFQARRETHHQERREHYQQAERKETKREEYRQRETTETRKEKNQIKLDSVEEAVILAMRANVRKSMH